MVFVKKDLYITGLFNGLYICSIGKMKGQPPSKYIKLNSNIIAISTDNEGKSCFVGTASGDIFSINILNNKKKLYISNCNIDGLSVCYCLSGLFCMTLHKHSIKLWDSTYNLEIDNNILDKEYQNVEINSVGISTEMSNELTPMAIGLNDGRILFYNLNTNTYLNRVRPYVTPITSLCFVNSNDGIVIGTIDGYIGYIQLQYTGNDNNISLQFQSHTLELTDKYVLSHNGEIDRCLPYINDTNYFLCTDRGRQVSVWKMYFYKIYLVLKMNQVLLIHLK